MIFRFIVKSALAGGSIYYSKELGVWGDSKDSTALYEEISNQLHPHLTALKKQIPLDLPYLPSSGEIGYLTKHYYNNGVKNTVYFIEMLPCYLGQWSQKGYNAVQEALNAGRPAVVEITKHK